MQSDDRRPVLFLQRAGGVAVEDGDNVSTTNAVCSQPAYADILFLQKGIWLRSESSARSEICPLGSYRGTFESSSAPPLNQFSGTERAT